MNFILGFIIGGIFGAIMMGFLCANNDTYHTITDENFRSLTEEEQGLYLKNLAEQQIKTGRNLFDMERDTTTITTIKARDIGKLKTKIYLDDESGGNDELLPEL